MSTAEGAFLEPGLDAACALLESEYGLGWRDVEVSAIETLTERLRRERSQPSGQRKVSLHSAPPGRRIASTMSGPAPRERPGPDTGGEAPVPDQPTPTSRRLVTTSTPGIYKRGSRYVVVFRDPGGKQRKRSARTLAEARALKSELTTDVQRGEYRALSKVTFEAYALDWLDGYQGRTAAGIREATRRDYRRVIEQRAIPFFGRLRLAEVEPRDVKRYVGQVAAEGVSRDTIRLALAPVRALFATALEEGLIRSNPATGVRVPASEKVEEGEEHAKALTDEELAALLAATAPEWRLFVELLAGTGLRIGEALALQWGDLDLGRRRLSVRRRWYKGDMAPPKSRYGRREIPLPPDLARQLWTLQGGRTDAEAFVFPGRAGAPVAATSGFRAVKAAAEAAGVAWAGPHTLRHTYATRCFRAGWNAVQVQLALGHHSPAFTLATYVHLLADDLPAADFLDDLPVGGNAGATQAAETGRDATVPEAAEARS